MDIQLTVYIPDRIVNELGIEKTKYYLQKFIESEGFEYLDEAMEDEHDNT